MAETDVVATPLLHRGIGSELTEMTIAESQDEGKTDGLTRGGVPLHRHRTEDEGWYIMEGRLRFRYGDREFDAPAGSGVLLPHGVAHTFWNPGPDPVRYLIIVRPKTAGLLKALHAPGRPGPGELTRLYASFDVDLLE
ncbi:MAG TPA: cupin domain-containing protein [Thermoplasmata archaeon]|nr:cupin domain-containing protein [Thermoplasmata archaeon]